MLVDLIQAVKGLKKADSPGVRGNSFCLTVFEFGHQVLFFFFSALDSNRNIGSSWVSSLLALRLESHHLLVGSPAHQLTLQNLGLAHNYGGWLIPYIKSFWFCFSGDSLTNISDLVSDIHFWQTSMTFISNTIAFPCRLTHAHIQTSSMYVSLMLRVKNE